MAMAWDAWKARLMCQSGRQWKDIGMAFGIDPHTVRSRLDPSYAAKRRGMTNERRRSLREQRSEQRQPVRRAQFFSGPILPPDFDTRSITGMICGDPLPGRSALDRRHEAPK